MSLSVSNTPAGRKFEAARNELIKWESAHCGQGMQKHDDPEYKRLYSNFKYWDNALVIGQEEYYERYWKPYFNNPKVCQTYKECGYKSLTPWTYKQYGVVKTHTLHCVHNSLRRTIILNDGTLVSISVSTGDGITLDNNIYVDLNGSKNPNRHGRDFLFSKEPKKNGIQPYGYDYTQEQLKKNCNKNALNYACAAKIIGDSWQIKDDYPW